MEFNSAEIQLMYAAVKMLRDETNEMLSTNNGVLDRDNVLQNSKHCNSILRKLKKFMDDNGFEPVDF